jgi:hypothetical protein
MNDVLATAAEALTAFAVWLDSVSPIPWPLALAVLFPPLVVAFRIWVWLMRGTVWPVSCAYPTTKRGFCKNPVPGEWNKCWRHRRRWTRRTDQHAVDPGLNRWEYRVKGRRLLTGAGFLRNNAGADTILFQGRGFARRPMAVLKYLGSSAWREEWGRRTRNLRENLRALRLHSVVSEDAFTQSGVSQRARSAADVMRTVLPVLAAGFAFTALSVPLDEGGRQAVQYIATACFVAVWGFARYGLWRGADDWRAAAHRQTALWFGGFMLAALIVGLLDEVSTTTEAMAPHAIAVVG